VPELIEVETYRALADEVVGRTVSEVHAPDDWFVKGSTAEEVVATMTGESILATRRRGKLLLMDTTGPTLGLRFGMTGRLLVDGAAAISKLEYSSDRNDPAWDRFALRFVGGGDLVLRDPRRLGGVELDPQEDALGIDATTVSAQQLAAVLASSARPLKARLLDQARVAGLGNLLVDETLWRAGLDPQRASDELTVAEVKSLRRTMRSTIRALTRRGGSHTGDLQSERRPGGICPKDGAGLATAKVGGRTTWFCPAHQH